MAQGQAGRAPHPLPGHPPQLEGAFPDTMTKCAELLNRTIEVDFVDINVGCPIDLVYKKVPAAQPWRPTEGRMWVGGVPGEPVGACGPRFPHLYREDSRGCRAQPESRVPKPEPPVSPRAGAAPS